ncbi:hypothetical protein ACFYZ2_05100 [Streptomyces sviceus]|uniref:hypothetical protein n=1 Tax=Streptomyces sviceus TaxID=285530 RepID=UPI0036C1C728
MIHSVRAAAAATVRATCIRRPPLVDGEVIGFRPADGTLKGDATNHASGTAVAIRPTWYPDARLKRLAARIRGWEDMPGQGAGTLSVGA